ncbi:MAG: chromosomal replication initiator DnaA [Beijerinckiaceae bacterium]
MTPEALSFSFEDTAPGWAPELAFSLAAAVWRLPRRALSGRNRADRYARARRLGLHLAHVGLGLSLTRASAALSRNRASARRACALTEDAREAPRWDHALDGLERALRLWCGVFGREFSECAQ